MLIYICTDFILPFGGRKSKNASHEAMRFLAPYLQALPKIAITSYKQVYLLLFC